MTGAYFAHGPCCMCGDLFTFNPELVCAIPVDENGAITPQGVKQPICRECMDKINAFRLSMHEAPIPILPGAYDVTEGFPP